MPTYSTKALLLGLVACAWASAAVPMTLNLQLGAATAQGDFRSEVASKVGFNTAVSLTIPLTATLALRPTLGHQIFPTIDNHYVYKSSRYSDLGDEAAHWSAWSYGADCLYRPNGPEGQLYFVAGAYLKAWKVHSFGTYSTADRLTTSPRIYNVDDTSTKNQPAIAAGLGWTLHRRFSVELRTVLGTYQSLSYNTVEANFVLSW